MRSRRFFTLIISERNIVWVMLENLMLVGLEHFHDGMGSCEEITFTFLLVAVNGMCMNNLDMLI